VPNKHYRVNILLLLLLLLNINFTQLWLILTKILLEQCTTEMSIILIYPTHFQPVHYDGLPRRRNTSPAREQKYFPYMVVADGPVIHLFSLPGMS